MTAFTIWVELTIEVTGCGSFSVPVGIHTITPVMGSEEKDAKGWAHSGESRRSAQGICQICLEDLHLGTVLSCVRCRQVVHASCQIEWSRYRMSQGFRARCAMCWSPWHIQEDGCDWEMIDCKLSRSRAIIRRCLRRVLEKALERRSLLRTHVVVGREEVPYLASNGCFKAVSHLESTFNDTCSQLTDINHFIRFRRQWARLATRSGERSLAPLFILARAIDEDTVVITQGASDVSKGVRELLSCLIDLDKAISSHTLLLEVLHVALRARDSETASEERLRDREDRDQDANHELRFGAVGAAWNHAIVALQF